MVLLAGFTFTVTNIACPRWKGFVEVGIVAVHDLLSGLIGGVGGLGVHRITFSSRFCFRHSPISCGTGRWANCGLNASHP